MPKQSTAGIAAFIIIVVAILAGIAYMNTRTTEAEDPALTAFAQCVADKKLTMYGAEWCAHCKREKALFGAAWKYVPYVECPENEALCLAKGIQGYPTWIDASGAKYEGEQGLEGIARISGCPLP
ncbi:MAG: protein disulfide isomerase family protein [Candidatus Paceibacterota bacterium]|jgi:hypothetical protein